MDTRKYHRKSKKFRKTRSKKQIGSGAQCSRPGFCINDELMRESRYGDTKTVAMLLENGADVNAKDEDGCTALFYASHFGHKDLVKMLLAAGAKVDDSGSKFGRTALDWASEYGRTEIAKMLKAAILEEVASNTIRRQKDRKNVDILINDEKILDDLGDKIRGYLGGGKRRTKRSKKSKKSKKSKRKTKRRKLKN